MSRWRNTKRTLNNHPILPGLLGPQGSRTHRLATPHEYALTLAKARLVVGVLAFTMAYSVIGARVAYLTLSGDPADVQVSRPNLAADDSNDTDSVTVRGDITDRNGTVLATSLPTVSLCADARKIPNPEEAEKQIIAALPDVNKDKLHDALDGGKHCAIVKRHLAPKQQYEVNRLGIAGLEFQPDERRVYPAGPLTAHVVGFTDIDNNGLGGIERSLDKQLQKNAGPVALSIDLKVQTILRRELKSAMTEFNAMGASGLIMDINTGELLAMVSLPDFDPQHPGNADDDARFNRDTLGVYEMGSTFKIFNTALALNSGAVRLSDSFDATKPIQIGRFHIRDFHPENRWLNVAEVFTHSSNIGSALMADRIGAVRQRTFLESLGLTRKTPIELPEVSAPLVPAAKDWSETTTKTVAFGHGIAVNAVQLVAAVATIINDGKLVTPTLLSNAKAAPPNASPVISSRTSAIMRGLMRLVVTRGTAKGAETGGYLVGGKTGTADKLTAGGRYDSHARMSSFVGVFPINAPKYAVFAMLDDPHGNAKTSGYATGGMVAAPIVGKVVAQIGPLLGVKPMNKVVEAAAERAVLKPLGAQLVDGLPVEEGSNYASVVPDSLE